MCSYPCCPFPCPCVCVFGGGGLQDSSGWAALIVDHYKMEQGLERDDGEGRHRSTIRWGTSNQPLHLLSSHRSQRHPPRPAPPCHIIIPIVTFCCPLVCPRFVPSLSQCTPRPHFKATFRPASVSRPSSPHLTAAFLSFPFSHSLFTSVPALSIHPYPLTKYCSFLRSYSVTVHSSASVSSLSSSHPVSSYFPCIHSLSTSPPPLGGGSGAGKRDGGCLVCGGKGIE